MFRCRLIFTALTVFAFTATLWASDAADHADPAARVALWLAVILLSAQVGGDLAARLGQPAVLGELLIGIVLGNLTLAGVSWLEPVKTDPSIDLLARLGVLLLLFEVGLESTVSQMLSVGLSSVLVAMMGVVAPFALGWGVGAWLLPEHGAYVHAFLGATLCATSVGITARVLKDLDRARSAEARVILGAAVVDDSLHIGGVGTGWILDVRVHPCQVVRGRGGFCRIADSQYSDPVDIAGLLSSRI